jgi:RNA polymerase sigma-70 factor (family 1)
LTEYKSLSDSELFDRLKQDDHSAYTEIYKRYNLVLLGHAYNQTRNREEAKDIVHEVFTLLWGKREHMLLAGNLSGFLYTSVRNMILNHIARSGVREKYMDSLIDYSNQLEENTDHLIRERQLKAMIEREIAALPKKMREIFEMSRNEHLSHKEIAEKLGLSDKTIDRQISNAIKILSSKLGVLMYFAFIQK